MKFLQLDFIPRSPDFGLLILRVWLGLSMLLLHGMAKIQNFEAMAPKFLDPFGIGSKASLGLAVFAEVVCSVLLVAGLFTRLGALMLAITMGVAFTLAHKAGLSREAGGELAFIYLAGYVTLFFAGAGKFSADAKLGGSR
jgi:putative oxidoreductase